MATGVDMRSTTKTRVQRRVEKKQAVLLVVLVFVVALTSFALGVIVGRSSVDPEIIVETISEPQRIAVLEPAESTATQGTSAPGGEEKLTFYDNLSKEETAPIGSGINLPPDSSVSVVERLDTGTPVSGNIKQPVTTTASDIVAAVKSDSVASEPVTAVSSPVPASSPKPAGLPPVVKGGQWVVQVFASQSAADAGIYRDKLSTKGYPSFITEADLGKKGIWYRVHLGPYGDKAAATQAQEYAEQKDKLKGFAKRR